MARPTIAALQTEMKRLRARITVALELHQPRPSSYVVGVICRVCRDPYPCDTALALGAPE
jgi:hypothetical protein